MMRDHKPRDLVAMELQKMTHKKEHVERTARAMYDRLAEEFQSDPAWEKSNDFVQELWKKRAVASIGCLDFEAMADVAIKAVERYDELVKAEAHLTDDSEIESGFTVEKTVVKIQ